MTETYQNYHRPEIDVLTILSDGEVICSSNNGSLEGYGKTNIEWED